MAVRALLNDLTARTIASANGNHWEDKRIAGSMHNVDVRITAIVLRALTEAAPNHPLIEETARWLAIARSSQRWKTNVERAQGMASLGAYAELTGETRGVYDYSVLVNASRVLAGDFDVPAGDYLDATTVALAELPLGEVSRVQFEREAGRRGADVLRAQPALRHARARHRGAEPRLRRLTPLLAAGRPRHTHYERLDRRCREGDGHGTRARRPSVREGRGLPARGPRADRPAAQHRLATPPRATGSRSCGGAARRAPAYYAPWYRWYWSPWDQVDLRDDRLVLLADRLPRGVHEYVYYARATTPGDFFVAPAHAEEAFFPEVFGRSDSGRFSVVAGE